jgi:nicotinamidase-related amidase
MTTETPLVPSKTALLIYDLTQPLVEEGRWLEPWVRDGLPDYARLLDACRQAGVLVTYALGTWDPDPQVCTVLAPRPGEHVFSHPVSGAFDGTPLRDILAQAGRDTLLISGMAVDRGCNLAAREALNLNLRAIVVRGACFTRDIQASPVGPVSKMEIERVHLAALARLGAGVLNIDEVVEALAAGTPAREGVTGR